MLSLYRSGAAHDRLGNKALPPKRRLPPEKGLETMTRKILNRAVLCAGSAPFALGLMLAASPAFAQTDANAPAQAEAQQKAAAGVIAPAAAQDDGTADVIVV